MAAAAAVPFGATRIIRLLPPTGQQSKSTSEEGKRWKEAISCERQHRWIGQISHERDLAPSCWWNALWRNSCPESTKTHTIAQHCPQVPRSIPFFSPLCLFRFLSLILLCVHLLGCVHVVAMSSSYISDDTFLSFGFSLSLKSAPTYFIRYLSLMYTREQCTMRHSVIRPWRMLVSCRHNISQWWYISRGHPTKPTDFFFFFFYSFARSAASS